LKGAHLEPPPAAALFITRHPHRRGGGDDGRRGEWDPTALGQEVVGGGLGSASLVGTTVVSGLVGVRCDGFVGDRPGGGTGPQDGPQASCGSGDSAASLGVIPGAQAQFDWGDEAEILAHDGIPKAVDALVVAGEPILRDATGREVRDVRYGEAVTIEIGLPTPTWTRSVCGWLT
jgi:hypothetical protein